MTDQNLREIYKDINMTLKRELDGQYQKWREIINNVGLDFTIAYDVIFDDCQSTRGIKEDLDNKINIQQSSLGTAFLDGMIEKEKLKELTDELEQFKVELNENFERFCDQVVIQARSNLRHNEQQGLSAERIQQFEKFQAQESFINEQCAICMGNIKIGRNMMRLDCDGQHTFCQTCVEEWFADHNTCPICRHTF